MVEIDPGVTLAADGFRELLAGRVDLVDFVREPFEGRDFLNISRPSPGRRARACGLAAVAQTVLQKERSQGLCALSGILISV